MEQHRRARGGARAGAVAAGEMPPRSCRTLMRRCEVNSCSCPHDPAPAAWFRGRGRHRAPR
eukprot:7140693-Prymnesium_polylepis.1